MACIGGSNQQNIILQMFIRAGVMIVVCTSLLPLDGMFRGIANEIILRQTSEKQQSIAFQQSSTETPSRTPTSSVSATQVISNTITATLSPNGSGTPSSTLSSTGTVSATLTYTPSASPLGTSTLTSTPATVTSTGIISPTTQVPIMTETVSPTSDFTPEIVLVTATLIPLPNVTFQFPQRITTAELLIIEHPSDMADLSKGGGLLGMKKLLRMWPLLVILGIWLVLGFWFVFSQYIFNRDR